MFRKSVGKVIPKEETLSCEMIHMKEMINVSSILKRWDKWKEIQEEGKDQKLHPKGQ